jgi:hemoglobin-like flavoprotein
MTEKQIALVRSSWSRVRQDGLRFAQEFYRLLFEIDPSLRTLFKLEMHSQQEKLVQMLDLCISHLDRFDTILTAVEDLGRRHEHYGVTAQHYPIVGRALVATLESQLGSSFAGEVRAAWLETYSTLSNAMKGSSESVPANVSQRK